MTKERIYGPKNVKPLPPEPNPAERFVSFLRLLTEQDQVSRLEIQEQLGIQSSAFYRYMRVARQLFKIKYNGSIAGNAYYSIDKKQLAKYFNIQRHHVSSS